MEQQKNKTNRKNGISNISKNRLNLSIILLDILAFIFIYFLTPKLLNLPTFSMNTTFQKDVIGLSFLQIYIMAFFVVLFIQLITLKALSKNINIYLEQYFHRKEIDYDIILKVRNDCLNVPYKFLAIQWGIAIFIGSFCSNVLYGFW